MNTADRGTGVLVCRGGHGTGIQHHQLGFTGRMGRRESLGGQLPLQCRAIGLRGTAAKALYKKSWHRKYYNVATERFNSTAAAHNQIELLQHLTSATKELAQSLNSFRTFLEFP